MLIVDNYILLCDNRYIKQVSNWKMIKYIATVNNDPYQKFGNKEFQTKQEAENYADGYNMGADYSHMQVFTVKKD